MKKHELLNKLRAQLNECLAMLSPEANTTRRELTRLLVRLRETLSLEVKLKKLGEQHT